MVEIVGRKVALRALERAHCRELWTAHEPVEPLATEPLRPGLSVEGADRWFEAIQAGQGQDRLHLGIFTRDEDRLVEDIQLSAVDWTNRTAEIGVGNARAADRRSGYARDALAAIMAYAFNFLDLTRLSAIVVAYNTAASAGLEAGALCWRAANGRRFMPLGGAGID